MTSLNSDSIKTVIVETPFKGATEEEQQKNIDYARACAHDCLVNHNEAPFLSHLIYTQVGILNDAIPAERQLGIDAGLAIGSRMEATIVYVDRGISGGMQYGIINAQKANRTIIYRSLTNQKFFIVTLVKAVGFIDKSKSGQTRFDATLKPGVYAARLIKNPSGEKNDSNWLLFTNTSIGATVEYVKTVASSIKALS